MNIYFTGELKTDEFYGTKLLATLRDHGIIPNSYCGLGGKAIASFTDMKGDYEAVFREITDNFHAENIPLEGQIDFCGDASGRYIIRNGSLHSYTQDDAILMDATVSDLLSELNRRSEEIFLLEFRRDGEQIHGLYADTFKKAFEKMKEQYDKYWNGQYPDYSFGKYHAYIQTANYRLEWTITSQKPFDFTDDQE